MNLVTDRATSRRMANIRQKATTPENLFAAWLRKNGIHASRQARDLPGSPDFANRRRRWAVWVHGCFWHRHRGCPRTTTPKRNRAFWVAKFAANVARDRRNRKALRALGYSTFQVWECALEKHTPALQRVLARIHATHFSAANKRSD
jgi:DNA mismatch endonuclease (patch repair protein)